MSDCEDPQIPSAKQTLQVDRESVLEAIAEFEREIPELAASAKRELLRAGEEYAPIEEFARLSFRVALLEARLALADGKLQEALRILSRRQVGRS